jgi:hypothetical protein
VEGFTEEPHELVLSWHFGTDFADVFEVRGFPRPQRGVFLPRGEITRACRSGTGYRRRVLDLVNLKVEGKEVTAVGPEVQRTPGIDLMDALTQSLAQRAAPATPPGSPRAPLPKKPPVKVGQRATAATPGRREQRARASKT